MKRQDVLDRLGFAVGAYKKKRVIVLSDIKTEADDQFAIVHHLLSPTEDVRGIIATHFEDKYEMSERLAHLKGTSMMDSYREGVKLLELMEIDDVPVVKGSQYGLKNREDLPESEGAQLIIEEAMREDIAPLFIACQGALTDLAIALKRQPEIADRMTAILIGGAPYPQGGQEPNLHKDIIASQIVFASGIHMWQIPSNTYGGTDISLAEVVDRIQPCGAIGAYLCEEMLAVNDFYNRVPAHMDWPNGETWSIGDNPTVAVLLSSPGHVTWHEARCPLIADDLTYISNPQGQTIRVYDSVDNRLCMSDLFAKLHLCYGRRQGE